MNGWISLVAYLLLAPIVGGLFAGADRILTARLQGRLGPPLTQPFWDVLKLLRKRNLVVNRHQNLYVGGFLLFTVLAGAIFFAGGDLLFTIFALTVGGIFLVLGAYSVDSPYSHLGAERELLQMLAYEPMVILMAIGLNVATGHWRVDAIVADPRPLIVWLPGVFLGFLFILTIKLRKSPFDLSTSHHGHQELVKGITTEFSGPALAAIEVAHWYENVLLMGFIWLFFAWNPWIAATVIVVAWVAEIVVDNASARLTWQTMVKSSWAAALLFGVLNLVALHYLPAAWRPTAHPTTATASTPAPVADGLTSRER